MNRVDASAQVQRSVLRPRSLNHALLVLGIVKARLSLCRIGILRVPSGIWEAPFPFLPKVGREFPLRRRGLFYIAIRHGHDFRLEKESAQKHQSCQPNPT